MLRTLERSITRLLGNHSGRGLLIGTFALVLVCTTALTVHLIATSKSEVVNQLLLELAVRIEDDLNREIDHYLDSSDRLVNRIASALLSSRVAVDDTRALHVLFQDLGIDAHDTAVSGVYFGRVDGSFAGMGLLANEWIDGDWHLSVSSEATRGALQFHALDDPGARGDPVERYGPYDPRERPWYRRAVEAGETATWSNMYANSYDASLTLTRARAIVDPSGDLLGVAGVDLFLGHLHNFIQQLDVTPRGEIFVIDGQGRLLGSNGDAFDDRRGVTPLSLGESSMPFARAAVSEIELSFGGVDRIDARLARQVELLGESGQLVVAPLAHGSGLDWSLGVFLPDADYVGSPLGWLMRVAPLILMILGIAIAGIALFAHLISNPLKQLRNGAARIAVGQFDVPIDTSCRNEIGDLARAIDGIRFRLRHSFEDLLREKQRAEITLDSIADGVISIGEDGSVRYMNASAETLTGQSFRSVRGMPIESVFKARDQRTGAPMTRNVVSSAMVDAQKVGREVVVTDTVGTRHFVQCRVSPIRGGRGSDNEGVVLIFSDLSQELRLRSELVHQASHDTLTDLVNRREFERRLLRAIETSEPGKASHVFCYIDLDQFKVVNDTCGHIAGDELLRQLARHLEQRLRLGDTVSRLGGDEYGILLEHCSLDEARRVVDGIRDSMADFRFVWDDRSFSVGLSAGLVSIDQSTASVMAAFRDADNACYIAKDKGRNRVHVHSDDDDGVARRRDEMQWVDRIEAALDQDRFELHAQSIVPTAPGIPVSGHFEVLLRLPDENGELISPAEFLRAAERYGLASKIDRWVVRHTLDWLAAYSDCLEHISICSINLSGQSLGDEDFLPFLADAVRSSQVPASHLCFEITETATIDNMASARHLIDKMRSIGCSFALDDFGSGMSSFAYLKNLPIQYLKIDGQFVRNMLDDRLDAAVVRSVHEIAQTMGLQTIAEFVENDAIRLQLEETGIDYVQGFGVDRPEPLANWLSAIKLESLDLSLGNGTWH